MLNLNTRYHSHLAGTWFGTEVQHQITKNSLKGDSSLKARMASSIVDACSRGQWEYAARLVDADPTAAVRYKVRFNKTVENPRIDSGFFCSFVCLNFVQSLRACHPR